jgi:cell division protein FtsI/penicillin-binding protein 2
MVRADARRIPILVAVVATVAAAVGARLIDLQVLRSEDLRLRAEDQYRSRVVVPATRGAIVDRNGDPLAISMEGLSLFAHPRRVEDRERAAMLLAPVIGLPRHEILTKLATDKPFVYLKRLLEPDVVERVRQLGLPFGDAGAFGFEREHKRVYPRGRIAAHVVGFATLDGEGVEGIERRYDETLRGDPTVYLVLQDARHGRMRERVRDTERTPSDVVLTIDLALQHVIERELDRAMEDTGAEAASAVLLDPKTGEILALANHPSPDANVFGRATDRERANRAVSSIYEPGSTFKIVAMAAALDRNRIRPNQPIWCENGIYAAPGRLIRDSSRHGTLTPLEILEKSSNIGMVKIAQTLSANELWQSIVAFGFGAKTGIELPGESRGLVREPAQWSGFSQASLSFGQEIGVTAVQMAQALATIANDGVLVPLRIVRGVRDPAGVLTEPERPAARRVVGASTAREVGRMLEAVVRSGTGERAVLAGYRVAGKSGTAQRARGSGYAVGEYVASFGGYAPASAPRLVALVVIEFPRGLLHQGGQVAAPVFGRILGESLRYLRVPPDDLVPPEIDARATTLAMSRRPKTEPSEPHRPVATPDGTIPDVVGTNLRDAITRLARRGVRPIVHGSGVVVSQEPPAGSPLAPGVDCVLTLGVAPPALLKPVASGRAAG